MTSPPHASPAPPDAAGNARPVPKRNSAIAWVAVLLVTAAAIGTLFVLDRSRENASSEHTALSESPKAVRVVLSRIAAFQDTRAYVGTLHPWVEANIGPQLSSGYVETVLVRPGDRVQRGEILATLDCRDAAAATRAARMAAKALEAERAAHAKEAARMQRLAEGAHVSRNEADLKVARSEADMARTLAAKAQLLSSSLRVNDCILKSPMDGEVIARWADPGAFIAPGESLLAVVDRSTVRVEAHAPESDFNMVAPDTPVRVRLLATGVEVMGTVARRSPGADTLTRTIHFEVDLDNHSGSLPVGTTARLQIDAAAPVPAVEVPLIAASVRSGRATVVVVEEGRARKVTLPVIGERGSSLFLEAGLPPGAHVVTQGRAQLREGDLVIATEASQEKPFSETQPAAVAVEEIPG